MRFRAKGPSIQIAWAKAISVGPGNRTNDDRFEAQRAGRSDNDRTTQTERLARWAENVVLDSQTWPAAPLWARLCERMDLWSGIAWFRLRVFALLRCVRQERSAAESERTVCPFVLYVSFWTVPLPAEVSRPERM